MELIVIKQLNLLKQKLIILNQLYNGVKIIKYYIVYMNQKKMNMYILAHKKMVKNNGLYIEGLTEIVTELKKIENKKGSF